MVNALSQNLTPSKLNKHAWSCVAGVLLALALLVACFYAKQLTLGEAIARGLMKPSNPIPAMICVGLAFAAPVYSAFCVALLAAPFRMRLAIGVSWFGIVMAALALGNSAWPEHDSPAMFNADTQFAIPVVTLGWCVPLLILRWLKGWRLKLSDTDSRPEQLTIASLLVVTFLSAICLSTLLYCRPGVQPIGLIGMLVSAALGFLLSLAIWLLMRVRFFVLAYFAIGLACFLILYFAMLSFGVGRNSTSTAVFITLFLEALLAGFVLARLGGAQLSSGRRASAGLQCDAREAGLARAN